MSSSQTKLGFFAALALLCACGGPAASPQPPLGFDPLEVATGGPGQPRHFPFAFDTSRGALVAYSEHEDEVIADPTDALVRISDRATSRAPNFYLTGIAELPDGTLYGASYITQAMGPRAVRSFGWTSRDGGASWQPRLGVVQLQQPGKERAAGWGALLFHRRLHVLPDGSIAGTMYGNHAADPDAYVTVWVTSRDLGASWQIAGEVAAGAAGQEGYGEPVSALCPDGSIVVIMRTGHNTPMRTARSRDGGRSWSPARELPFIGWDPDLLRVGGSLYLTFGTPDRGAGVPAAVYLARSEDCGQSWRGGEPIADIPTSSGYTGLALHRGALVIFTDTQGERAIRGFPAPQVR